MSEKQRKIADWKTRVNQLNQDAEELLTEIKVIRVNAENLYIPEAYKLGEAMDAINVALCRLHDGRHRARSLGADTRHGALTCPVVGGTMTCGDYDDGYMAGLEVAHAELRVWQLGDHAATCDCEPCETVRIIVEHVLLAAQTPVTLPA